LNLFKEFIVEKLASKPLRDKKIIVACSANKMSSLVANLQALGACALPFPVIEVRGVDDTGPLDRTLSSLHTYDWIIFTSVHGVLHFFRRYFERNISKEAANQLKFCAIGPATARALKENGIDADLIPQDYVAEGVIDALIEYCGGLPNLKGRRILIPRAKVARDILPNTLKAAGAQVDIVPCYQTMCAEIDEDTIHAIMSDCPDMIVFTSSSTVRNMVGILGEHSGRNLLQNSTVAAIGQITADSVRAYGKEVEIIPKKSTIDSLIQAIREYYTNGIQ
jgi:uroporphyrinogen III methyltransferase/synthase